MNNTMTCLCDRTHTFPEGVYTLTCECGFELVLMEEVCDDRDDEPGDLDSDEGYNPYTGARDDDGYDTGCFDD